MFSTDKYTESTLDTRLRPWSPTEILIGFQQRWRKWNMQNQKKKCLPIHQHIRNVLGPYLYRATMEVVPQIGMAGVVFILLQAVQYCLFKKLDLWPCTALCRQRAQLLHTWVQTHKIPFHLLPSDRTAKPKWGVWGDGPKYCSTFHDISWYMNCVMIFRFANVSKTVMWHESYEECWLFSNNNMSQNHNNYMCY